MTSAAPLPSPRLVDGPEAARAAGGPRGRGADGQTDSTDHPQRPLILAGKSMGGRVASLLADELAALSPVRGCLCLGYPFHPPGKPLRLRTEHLAILRTPTLILQGERDSFGGRHEVEAYNLSPQVQLGWIPSGDHSFKPTRSSGLSEQQNWALAVELSDAFLRNLLGAEQGFRPVKNRHRIMHRQDDPRSEPPP